MRSRHAALIRRAQDMAALYSLSTGHLLENVVRALPPGQAEQVLELARRIDDEATIAAYADRLTDAHGADHPQSVTA
jgi:hypothetical protein